MSIIQDVRRDLHALAGKTDTPALRKFGLLVGGVFAVLGAWFLFRHKHEALGMVFLVCGGLLLVFGAFAPQLLRHVHLAWMGLAMTLGWVVSRLLLILLFCGIVVPIGLVARLVGKRFLDLPRRGERETMWIPRPAKTPNYERLY